jgi:hypothetical protein
MDRFEQAELFHDAYVKTRFFSYSENKLTSQKHRLLTQLQIGYKPTQWLTR